MKKSDQVVVKVTSPGARISLDLMDKMDANFYVGHDQDIPPQSLDISSMTNLDQLTRTLAEIFTFADVKCTSFCAVNSQ